MEFKKITGQAEIPVVGLGTWTIGGEDEADTTQDKKIFLQLRL